MTIEKGNENPTEVMKVIEKDLDKAKYKSFGKVTVRNDLKTDKEIKTPKTDMIRYNL